MNQDILIKNKRLLITQETLDNPSKTLSCRCWICALYEDRRMIEAVVQPAGAESILNNIYIARVQNVVPHLNAAFVEIEKGRKCFLPLDDLKNPIFTKKISKKPIAAGDELAVQVTKEAVKTKDAAVTSNLSFTGEYLVLTSANHKIGVSKKLQADDRRRLLELAQQLRGQDAGYGLILRTNAAQAEEAAVRAEFAQLKAEYDQLAASAGSRTLYSCLRRERPFYLKMLMDTDKSLFKEVLTDLSDIAQELKTYAAGENYGVRLYEDAQLPLSALYNVRGQLEDALNPRIWLKSGANIIIQHTEALTVIDVNSGRNISKKDKLMYHYKINLEAAAEIARQLRLRSISGIIIVDFIDLCDDALNASLLAEFRGCLKRDPVPVQLVDMTKLGLVELTRRKQKKPLYEQLCFEKEDHKSFPENT